MPQNPLSVDERRAQGQALDDAIADFAVAYRDQNRSDYRDFIKAIRQGRIEVQNEI